MWHDHTFSQRNNSTKKEDASWEGTGKKLIEVG